MQKCALFAIFHSKRAIFMVQKRQHFVIFQLFNVKMSFRLKEDEKYVEISPLKQKPKKLGSEFPKG